MADRLEDIKTSLSESEWLTGEEWKEHAAWLIAQLESTSAERDAAIAERDAFHSEADAEQGEPDA